MCEPVCAGRGIASQLHHVCVCMNAMASRLMSTVDEDVRVRGVGVHMGMGVGRMCVIRFVVELARESLQQRYSCCSACLSRIQITDGQRYTVF